MALVRPHPISIRSHHPTVTQDRTGQKERERKRERERERICEQEAGDRWTMAARIERQEAC
eukprot:878576-Rhodomonas_salina.2